MPVGLSGTMAPEAEVTTPVEPTPSPNASFPALDSYAKTEASECVHGDSPTMNIFLLSGYAGVGKSTIAKQLQGVLPECERTAFAKAVKDSVSKIYGIERYVLDTQEGKQTRVHGGGTVRDEIILYAERRKHHEGDGVWAKEV